MLYARMGDYDPPEPAQAPIADGRQSGAWPRPVSRPLRGLTFWPKPVSRPLCGLTFWPRPASRPLRGLTFWPRPASRPLRGLTFSCCRNSRTDTRLCQRSL